MKSGLDAKPLFLLDDLLRDATFNALLLFALDFYEISVL